MTTEFGLLKALIALTPASILLVGSTIMFFRERALASSLQLLGAGGLALVVIAHICEALRLFPGMGWGDEQSPGHYFDLLSAMIGLTAFPVGYLLCAINPLRASDGDSARPAEPN